MMLPNKLPSCGTFTFRFALEAERVIFEHNDETYSESFPSS